MFLKEWRLAVLPQPQIFFEDLQEAVGGGSDRAHLAHLNQSDQITREATDGSNVRHREENVDVMCIILFIYY